ncbi:MAG TPA: hypothetical protein VLV85_16125 [Stellaceae bacterium]|jgi:hypothetical protein|nr:hypothetical protein [Stellaceae bacterium]
MPPPTPPLALSPVNLALLQQRQPNLPARPGEGEDAPSSERPAPAPPPANGRGRLVDILA